MNLNYLYRQLRKRMDLKHFEIKPIGSAIRLKRKEMGMTLEEGAEGICSISYLSKLENNQIDPNLDFVDQLVERFGLKDQITFDIEKYDNDLKEFIELMINLEKPKRSFIENYQEREDHQARVIQLIETSIKEDYQTVFEHFKVIQQFIPHLKQEELVLVMLCVGEALIRHERYQEAYRVINEVPKIDKELHLELYILCVRLRLRLSFSMHKMSDIGQYYEGYIREVLDHGYDHLAKEMKCFSLFYMAHYQSPFDIKKAICRFDRLNDLENLPYAMSCYIHHFYDEVIIMASKRTSLSNWLIIYLLSLEAKKEIEALIDVVNYKLPAKLYPSEAILIDYLRFKHTKDQEKFMTYIRKNILNHYIDSDHYILLEYLMHDASKIFSKAQFYKEANLISTQFQTRLKSLKIASIQTNNGA